MREPRWRRWSEVWNPDGGVPPITAYKNPDNGLPPLPAGGPAVLFSDDFETGDLSKWDGLDNEGGPIFGTVADATTDQAHGGAHALRLLGDATGALTRAVAATPVASGVVEIVGRLYLPSGTPDWSGAVVQLAGGDQFDGTPRGLAELRVAVSGGAAVAALRLRSRGADGVYTTQSAGAAGLSLDGWHAFALRHDARGADPIGTLTLDALPDIALTDATGDTPAAGMFVAHLRVQGQEVADGDGNPVAYAYLDDLSVADGDQGTP